MQHTDPVAAVGLCCCAFAGMQDDAGSSEGDEEAQAGPSDHAMEDDSLQDFEGHQGEILLS